MGKLRGSRIDNSQCGRFLPVLVEPKLNPVAGAAAVVVAAPKLGAVRATTKSKDKELTHQLKISICKCNQKV